MTTENKIKEIMVSILGCKMDEIEEDSAIGDIENWDSLNHLKIISEIENRFGIQFTPDVLMDMEDFSDIVKATEDRI